MGKAKEKGVIEEEEEQGVKHKNCWREIKKEGGRNEWCSEKIG